MGNKPQVEKQARKLYVGDRLDVLCSDGVWRGSEVVKLENAKGSEGVTVLTDATMEIVQLDFTNRRHVSRIAGEGKFSKVATVEPPKQRTAPVKVPDGESTDGSGSGSGTTAGAAAATSRLSSSLVNSVPLLSITLEDVMASATLQPFFVVYVEAHFDRDDLHFLLQAQSFKRMLEGPKGGRGAATVAHCVSKARAIAGRFVQLDSLDTVELPLQLRNDILGRLRRQCDANVLRDVFDAAVKEISSRMAQGAFRSFLRSREYRWMVKTDAVSRYAVEQSKKQESRHREAQRMEAQSRVVKTKTTTAGGSAVESKRDPVGEAAQEEDISSGSDADDTDYSPSSDDTDTDDDTDD